MNISIKMAKDLEILKTINSGVLDLRTTEERQIARKNTFLL